MDCNDFNRRLDDHLDTTLDAAMLRQLETHVVRCAPCTRRLARARALLAALRAHPVDVPTADFEARALRRATERMVIRRRGPWLAAAALVAALAGGLVALVATGRSGTPVQHSSQDAPSVVMAVDEPRTINLVFAAATALDDVLLLVDLPVGVEIPGYEGQRQVEWRTSLQAGKNVLPLDVMARGAMRGQIVARLKRGEHERVFTVLVTAVPG
jgi:anti-sigma factor RsiW